MLKLIKAQPCPQQTNGVDCGLFAVAVSILIVADLEVQKDTFTQADISDQQFIVVSTIKETKLHCDIKNVK